MSKDNREESVSVASSNNADHNFIKDEAPFLSDTLKEQLQVFPEVLDYIEMLEKIIKKQKKKLKRIKSKFKKAKVKDVSVQTDNQLDLEPKNIIEDIKEAAELATQNTGFVYDERTGMYYDSNTGYYYNAEYGLYYEPTTGIYRSYKQETNTYEFHSQVCLPPQENHNGNEVRGKRKKKKVDEMKASKCPRLQSKTPRLHEPEEGECSSSSEDGSSDESISDESDIVTQWPPCMRLIVEQSQTPKVKLGSLNILTFEGGTLGREGNHAIILPDISVSKSHLKFSFDEEKNMFLVTDLGSRNGTVLNGRRMSASKQESEVFDVAHGSRLQVGSVVLLCHVHDGNKTCGHCEPGLVQKTEKKAEESKKKVSKSEQHKNELKKLRKKFGVNPFEEGHTKLASGYTDRAQKRRNVVGSQNPHEKTEVASLNESISSTNKGFKMLAKMGWKEGESLGKDNQGVLQPIPLVSNPGTSGIGSKDNIITTEVVDITKQNIWKKTQERFKQISNVNVFEDSD